MLLSWAALPTVPEDVISSSSNHAISGEQSHASTNLSQDRYHMFMDITSRNFFFPLTVKFAELKHKQKLLHGCGHNPEHFPFAFIYNFFIHIVLDTSAFTNFLFLIPRIPNLKAPICCKWTVNTTTTCISIALCKTPKALYSGGRTSLSTTNVPYPLG